MCLKVIPITVKKSRFWERSDLTIKAKGYKFKIPVGETAGYYQILQNEKGTFFLFEADGTRVFVSSFTLSYKDVPLWESLWVLGYNDVRDPNTGLIYDASTILKRYLP